jgi:hypothetical protein
MQTTLVWTCSGDAAHYFSKGHDETQQAPSAAAQLNTVATQQQMGQRSEGLHLLIFALF